MDPGDGVSGSDGVSDLSARCWIVSRLTRPIFGTHIEVVIPSIDSEARARKASAGHVCVGCASCSLDRLSPLAQ